MARRARRRFVRLVERLDALGVPNGVRFIVAGQVMVDGRIIDNPNAWVPVAAAVVIRHQPVLRGARKLRAALAHAGLTVEGKACLDLGAASGGFTTALLEAGARKVYAVDTGYGQLLGALRQHHRVVNLERTNLADLDARRVPEAVEVLTVDLSYVPLAEALGQLGRVSFAPGAELLGLVKPTFELRKGSPVRGGDEIDKAFEIAAAGAEASGWQILGSIPSPTLGRAQATEVFLHAVRPAAPLSPRGSA